MMDPGWLQDQTHVYYPQQVERAWSCKGGPPFCSVMCILTENAWSDFRNRMELHTHILVGMLCASVCGATGNCWPQGCMRLAGGCLCPLASYYHRETFYIKLSYKGSNKFVTLATQTARNPPWSALSFPNSPSESHTYRTKILRSENYMYSVHGYKTIRERWPGIKWIFSLSACEMSLSMASSVIYGKWMWVIYSFTVGMFHVSCSLYELIHVK